MGASGHGPPGGGGWAGATLAWVGWWLVLLGFWLALSNAATAQDLAAGAVAATLGATASVLVRQQRRYVARPRLQWILRLGRPIAQVPGDLVRLVQALVRPTAGELVEVRFDPGGEDARGAARRLLAIVGGSLAPDTVVIEIDEERGVLVAHRLAGRHGPDPLELG
jgi:multisubunit Na+/H+ antiporter MnhE subunit